MVDTVVSAFVCGGGGGGGIVSVCACVCACVLIDAYLFIAAPEVSWFWTRASAVKCARGKA